MNDDQIKPQTDLPNFRSGFDETARLQNEFARVQSIGGGLALQLAALQRDEAEANQKLIAALQARQDVRPWLREIRDILLQRAATSEAFGTNANEVAALCRQSAHAIEKILSS